MAQAAGYRWVRWARERRLKGSRQAVLLAISTHANSTGQAYLTMATIAAEAGCGTTAAKKAVWLLAAGGYLDIAASKGRNANAYRLGGSQLRLMDAPAAVPEPEPAPEPEAEAPPRVQPADLAPDPETAFYKAKNQGQKVAAIIDAARVAGREVVGDRVAGFVRHQKASSPGDVWKAIAQAFAEDGVKGCRIAYAEGILRNGRVPARSRKPGRGKKSAAPAYGNAAAEW